MARTTTYGVFKIYKGVGGKLEVRPPTSYPTEEKALSAAETFALVLGGAVAYSRVIDPDRGTAEDGVILGRSGLMADPKLDATAA